MFRYRFVTIAAIAVASLFPFAAQAHVGNSFAGLGSGLLHPLLGADHVLAMLGIGLWAGRHEGWRATVLPVAFLVALALGALVGFGGFALPALELGITGSVVIVGLILALDVSVALPLAAGLAAAFAVFHGYAHGPALAAAASPVAFVAGLLSASGGLLAAGIAAARLLQGGVLRRLSGAALVLFGGLLALQA